MAFPSKIDNDIKNAKKRGIVDGKAVYYLNKSKNYPSLKQLNSVYSKIADSKKIPVVMQTRESYLKQYVRNQEMLRKTKFSNEQKQQYMQNEMEKLQGVDARYTTKSNKYIPPRVVIFPQHNKSEERIKENLFHEYGHEVWERTPKLKKFWKFNKATSPTLYGTTDKEEDFAESFMIAKMNKPSLINNPNAQVEKRMEIVKDIASKNDFNPEIIKNPKSKDIQRLFSEFKIKFPNAPPGTPKIRSTYDDKGNKYVWRSDEAIHSFAEPLIKERENVEKLSQNPDIDFKKEKKESIAQDPSPNVFTPSMHDEDITAAEKFGARNIARLKKIGEGRDRIVYVLDNDKVLKIAKNPMGLIQNQSERDLEYLDLLKQHEHGKDYVVMERAEPPGKAVSKMHSKLRKAGVSSYSKIEDLSDAFIKAGVPEDYRNYDVAMGDFMARRNWGEKEGQPVLVDAGTLNQKGLNIPFGTKIIDTPEWLEIKKERKEFEKKGPEMPIAQTTFGKKWGVVTGIREVPSEYHGGQEHLLTIKPTRGRAEPNVYPSEAKIINPEAIRNIHIEKREEKPVEIPESLFPDEDTGKSHIPLEKAKYITLYHGMQKKHIPNIMEHGLEEESRLTSNEGTALFHAERGPEKELKGWVISPEGKLRTIENPEPAILQVKVPLIGETRERILRGTGFSKWDDEFYPETHTLNPKEIYEYTPYFKISSENIKEIPISKVRDKVLHQLTTPEKVSDEEGLGYIPSYRRAYKNEKNKDEYRYVVDNKVQEGMEGLDEDTSKDINQIYLDPKYAPIKKSNIKYYGDTPEEINKHTKTFGEGTGAFMVPSVYSKVTFLGERLKNVDFNKSKNIKYLSNVLGHEEIHGELQKIGTPKVGVSKTTSAFDDIVIPTITGAVYDDSRAGEILNPYSAQSIEPSFKKNIGGKNWEEDKPMFDKAEQEAKELDEDISKDRVMNKELQIEIIKKQFGEDADLIDLNALVDTSLSLPENIASIKGTIKTFKGLIIPKQQPYIMTEEENEKDFLRQQKALEQFNEEEKARELLKQTPVVPETKAIQIPKSLGNLKIYKIPKKPSSTEIYIPISDLETYNKRIYFG